MILEVRSSLGVIECKMESWLSQNITQYTRIHVQVQSTRLVTPHSLWPTNVDTGKWSSISLSLITVIQKVNPILSFLLTCWH